MRPPHLSRLQALLLALVVLGLARWGWPLHSESAPQAEPVAQAIVRPRASIPALASAPIQAWQRRAPGAPPGKAPSASSRDEPAESEALAGNPFAVRLPPPVMPPTPAVAVAAPSKKSAPAPVVIAPVAPPVPAAPSLQIIGTWKDGTGWAVFVAGPSGTLIARPGTTLLGQYSVTSVTPQTLSLRHIASQREFQIPVPRAPGA